MAGRHGLGITATELVTAFADSVPGNSGLVGWTAVNVLRKIGIEIDPDIWDKLFPEDGRTSAEPAPHILRVCAGPAERRSALWRLSASFTRRPQLCRKPWTSFSNDRARRASIQRPRYQQVTLVDNSVRPERELHRSRSRSSRQDSSPREARGRRTNWTEPR